MASAEEETYDNPWPATSYVVSDSHRFGADNPRIRRKIRRKLSIINHMDYTV
jgi:hypothetical protein